MDEDFTKGQLDEFMHGMLELALSSDKHYIIIGRAKGVFDEHDTVVYDVEGYHPEDVVSVIEDTITQL